MALISKLANAYASLAQPAAQRSFMQVPRTKPLAFSAGQRQSQAVQDLMQTPEQEGLDLDMAEEQKKRKRLLDAGRSGIMSAAYFSLMGESGNQF